MKIDNDVVEFFNKIIKKSKSKEELISNLKTYRDYLILTEIYDEETLGFSEKLLKEADKIFTMKDSFGTFDITGIINNEQKETKKTTPKVKQKHYNHYVKEESNYSGGCNSSFEHSNSCSSSSLTYGSSCGSSTPIYRGC